MRSKVSELCSSFSYYLKIGEYKDSETLDIITDFTPDGYNLIELEDTGMIDIIKEMFEYNGDYGDLHVSTPISKAAKTNCEYVLSFDKFIKEGFQKRPPQDPDYDDRPKGWRDDFEDEDEEE